MMSVTGPVQSRGPVKSWAPTRLQEKLKR